MPSSVFMILEGLDWFDGSDGLGDTGIRMSESDFITCPDGSYASGPDACPGASGGPSSVVTCGPGEVAVNNPDWAKPICMTADMAVNYGRGVQLAQTPTPPSIPWGWIGAGAVALVLVGSLTGRRR